MGREVDGDTNCNWCTWNGLQRLGKRIGCLDNPSETSKTCWVLMVKQGRTYEQWTPMDLKPLKCVQSIGDHCIRPCFTIRVGHSAKMYTYQLWANSGCPLDDLSRVMADWDTCWERVNGIIAVCTSGWYLYGIMVRVIAKWSERPGFNPRSNHTKDSKMVLDAALLNTQYYKKRIKAKWSNLGNV